MQVCPLCLPSLDAQTHLFNSLPGFSPFFVVTGHGTARFIPLPRPLWCKPVTAASPLLDAMQQHRDPAHTTLPSPQKLPVRPPASHLPPSPPFCQYFALAPGHACLLRGVNNPERLTAALRLLCCPCTAAAASSHQTSVELQSIEG